MCRKVYFNGEFIPESEAKISIYDSALMFGDTVFEMTRSFNKHQFKLKSHLERLYASAKYMHISIPISMDEMASKVSETIDINDPVFEKDDEHRIMINITRGILSIYQEVLGVTSQTNVIIADFPLKWTVRGMGVLYDKGINAVIVSQRSIPASLIEPKVKSRSRLHLMMANIQASRIKGENNWALMLDSDGFISEGTGDNFFIVKNEKLITPEGRNILRGISRAYIFELAREYGIQCVEKNIEPYDVLDADEAFMTGTPFCILPVVSLDGVVIGTGRPSSFVQELLRLWGRRVDVNIKKQIQDWDVERKNVEGCSPYKFQESK